MTRTTGRMGPWETGEIKEIDSPFYIEGLHTPGTAQGICYQAAALVSGDRAKQHGDKMQNHLNIAALWTAYLGWGLTEPLTAQNVALMLVLLKVARTKTGSHNLDDYTDLCGYAGIAGEIAEYHDKTLQEAIPIGGTD